LRNTTYIVPAEGALTVFTDGACLPTPRRGGIGIRFVHSDHLGNETIWDFEEPGYAGATSNQMELQAVITAMKAIEDRRVPAELLEDVAKIDIYTDSLYVADNLNTAIFEWPRTGTRRSIPSSTRFPPSSRATPPSATPAATAWPTAALTSRIDSDIRSLRRHDPDQVRRVHARKRSLSPSHRDSPVHASLAR
jgi:ribonuclease HI